jgi:hypothetical protein
MARKRQDSPRRRRPKRRSPATPTTRSRSRARPRPGTLRSCRARIWSSRCRWTTAGARRSRSGSSPRATSGRWWWTWTRPRTRCSSGRASATGARCRCCRSSATRSSPSRASRRSSTGRAGRPRRSRAQARQGHLFADLEKTLRESDRSKRVEFYTHEEGWKNKLICGDSLHVMESLLHYENLRGKVQMIYIDPPYGIKYDSNFQQRVDSTKNDEKDAADDVLTIKAFRDTWALGIHSYLSYLRERLYLVGSCLRSREASLSRSTMRTSTSRRVC